MKPHRCQGCKIIIEENEKTYKILWPNHKTGKKENMEFCSFCHKRRLQGIPIKGHKK